MRWNERLQRQLSGRRAQHLVFLVHVWLCVPLLVWWVMDRHVSQVLGKAVLAQLTPLVWFTVAYISVRTVIAWIDPRRLRWEFIFPPIDVALITAILFVSQRGPMSNLTLLFFLPIIEAAGTLLVRWAAVVGVLVVLGTAISGLAPPPELPHYTTAAEMLRAEPLNIVFRLYFLLIVSSLMTYQALIAAGFRERLAVAQARHRISQEMHDGVQGHLITMASQLELLTHVIDRNEARAKSLVAEIKDEARQAADELRYLVRRTESAARDGEFLPALRQYADHLCQRNGLELEFSIKGAEDDGSPEWETIVFRIAQEALNNIIKHAKASRVRIELALEMDWARLTVADDGAGFDSSLARDGMGTSNMHERAKRVGGSVEIESQVGEGTIIRASLPRAARHG